MITEVQREQRRHVIGSSDVAAILGLSPYATAYDIWAQKKRDMRPRPDNEATELGNQFEPLLIDWASQRLGLVGLERDVVLTHAEFPFMASNADACGLVSKDEKIGIEAKTAGLAGPLVGEWGEDGTNEIPDPYFMQTQFQMACGGMKVVAVPVLLGCIGRRMYYIKRNDEVIARMMATLLEFWHQCILADRPPPKCAPSDETVRFMRRPPGKRARVRSTSVDAWAAARDTRLAAEKVEEDLKLKMLGEIGDAEEGLMEDGRLLTYYEIARKGFTVKETTYRTAKISKTRLLPPDPVVSLNEPETQPSVA